MASVGFSLPDSATLRETVNTFLAFAAVAAQWTKTTVDDTIVTALRKIVDNSNAWDLFYGILSRLVERQEVPAALPPVAEDQAIHPRVVQISGSTGIDIATLIMLIEAAMKILDWWRKRRQVEPNPQPVPNPVPVV